MKNLNWMIWIVLIALVGWGSPKPRPTPTPVVTAIPCIPTPLAKTLSWESSSHPERAAWSKLLHGYVLDHWASLNKATDASFFYPTWALASAEVRQRVWEELWVAIALKESSWNVASASVDVGDADKKDTWSIGLLQMSVVDQENYGFKFGYKYADLLTAGPNLRLGLAIMAEQIDKYGHIAIKSGEPGLYWAVIHPGGKYDSSAAIAARVQQNVPASNGTCVLQ